MSITLEKADSDGSQPQEKASPNVSRRFGTHLEALTYIENELCALVDLKMVDQIKVILLKSLLSLIRAAKECDPPQSASKYVDRLVETLGEIDDATRSLIAAKQAQVDETLAEFSDASAARILPPEEMLASIEKQLGERIAEHARTAEIQEQLEEEVSGLEEKLRIAEQLLQVPSEKRKARADTEEFRAQIASHNETISSLIESAAANSVVISKLKTYKEAVAVVRKGPPKFVV